MSELYDGNVGLGTIIRTHLMGLFIGYIGWADNERRYQKALTEARVKNAPAGILPEKHVIVTSIRIGRYRS